MAFILLIFWFLSLFIFCIFCFFCLIFISILKTFGYNYYYDKYLELMSCLENYDVAFKKFLICALLIELFLIDFVIKHR